MLLDGGFTDIKYTNFDPTIRQQFSRVDSFVRQNFQALADTENKLVYARRLGSTYYLNLVYEGKFSAYRVKAVTKDGSIIVYSYGPLYENLSQVKYVYPNLENEIPADLKTTVETVEFKTAQNVLFRSYGHFLMRPQLMQIF